MQRTQTANKTFVMSVTLTFRVGFTHTFQKNRPFWTAYGINGEENKIAYAERVISVRVEIIFFIGRMSELKRRRDYNFSSIFDRK